MKIYLNNLNENWIVDRFKSEWYKFNKDISTRFYLNADIIWIIAPWTFKNKDLIKFKNKKIVCTIHHFENIDVKKEFDEKYSEIDNYVTAYHVISNYTYEHLKKLTDKPIFNRPFWVNQNTFFDIQETEKIKNYFKFNKADFLIGTFQRDSDGRDLNKPKLIKGPDRFIEIVKKMHKLNPNLKVVLTGTRRNYIKNELKNNLIPFYLFEMSNSKNLNYLYNCLNLYIVSSRIEGGPQSIMECAITKTPIISTDVGFAKQFLAPESIFNMSNFETAKPNVEFAYKKVSEFTLNENMNYFRNFFSDLL